MKLYGTRGVRRWREVAALVSMLLAAHQARANDLDLIVAGSTGGIHPPPNILFVFDSSASMNNLPCEDQSGTAQCDDDTYAAEAGPLASTICVNSALEAVSGPDLNGDGSADPYLGQYATDGTTFNNYLYPTYDDRGSVGTTDDFFLPATVWTHVSAGSWTRLETGTGASNQIAIDDAIDSECAAIDDCRVRSRCVYSLRTRGYFRESTGSTCGTGDPLLYCVGKLDDGVTCTNDSQCKSDDCGGSPKTCRAASFTQTGPYFLGDFLNFYPPKGITLIKSFVDAVTNMNADARLGVSSFHDLDAAQYGTVAFDLRPPCNVADDPDCTDGDPATACFGSSYFSSLVNYLYNTLDFDYVGAPLAKALDNAGKSYTAVSGTSSAICSISGCEASNFIVLVTDGTPSSDATNASQLPWVNGLTGFGDGYFNANGELVDDVARALNNIDHRTDLADDQKLVTYTVSFGALDSADPTKCVGLLEQTATAGGGRCFPASSADALEEALLEVILEIVRRAQGFTAPSVPTTRMAGTTSLTNAVFLPTADFPLWEGHLFGFQVCDEKLARNTNAECVCEDNNIDEVCIEDAAGNDIAYNDQGYLLSRPHWDAALCLAGDVAGTLPAVDMDLSNFDVSGCYRSATDRTIKTAVAAQASPTNAIGSNDQIDFDAAGVTPTSALYTALACTDEPTAEKVVNFYRGFDAYDHDGDTITTEDRNLNTMQDGSGEIVAGWWKFGDVFHSIPNVVERPTGRGLGAWALTDSYQEFAEDNAARDKVILVGANDGMLHAFHAGTWIADDEAYDFGTGEELWAFVSPELLPNLKNVCSGSGCALGNHPFMVDGSVMVRDIWTGDSDPDAKLEASNASDWKTIAVYGHRDGGSTYVALDVTDIDSPLVLWQFPQPGTVEASQMGKSWLDVFPSPAAIGPVRQLVSGVVTDRWVVILSGGYDPLDQKGNFLVMLDAYTGAILWKAEHVASSATDRMRYSFPASPTFYADLSGPLPYIAGIVAADHGGQLWHVKTPAQALTAGAFTYEPTLFFSTLPDTGTPSRVYPDTDATLEASDYQRRPFFFAPTLTANNGKVRVVIASGDRDNLIPVSSLDDDIEDYVCDDQQRLYAIDIGTCTSGGTPRPCTEADLTEVNPTTGQYALETARGWFYALQAGEKSATPYDIFNGYALYSTFYPEYACGNTTNQCGDTSAGKARLYARHYLTGKLLDWDNDGTIATSESYRQLGDGVPTAPAVSASVGPDGVTPTIFAGGSDSGQGTTTPEGLGSSSVAMEIMRFSVTREMHDILHQ